jgi:glutamate synthase domain-containing protein 2
MELISQPKSVAWSEESPLKQGSDLPKPISDPVIRLIQERAAGIRQPESFGSSEDLELVGAETLIPSYEKASLLSVQPKITIGSLDCSVPYDASLLNASGLSFGPMSKNFILAMNKAAQMGGFYQNTGEAGISPYHYGVEVDVESPDFEMKGFIEDLLHHKITGPESAGDVVWQIGTGYFGCRTSDGKFDPEQFSKKASIQNVRMIEVKLSQGVEPCKTIPMKHTTAGIEKIMGIDSGQDAVLRPAHSAFSSPIELIRFIQELRTLCGGKPVGLKLGIYDKEWFFAICKAMIKTGILVDFITVDGMEAGTAAASKGAMGFTGTPLNEAIVFVHNALTATDLRKYIRIVASGKIFTERDMILKLARGADICATARGMMVAVGCDQQQECYKGTCLQGIATQDPQLMNRLSLEKSIWKLYNYHKITLEEFLELMSIAGITHPGDLGPHQIQKRISLVESKPLDELYTFLPVGGLRSMFQFGVPADYRKYWNYADSSTPFSSKTNCSRKNSVHST